MALSLTTLQRIDKAMRSGTSTTVADIASAYGLSSASLSSQLSRARRRGQLPAVKMGKPKTLVSHMEAGLKKALKDAPIPIAMCVHSSDINKP